MYESWYYMKKKRIFDYKSIAECTDWSPGVIWYNENLDDVVQWKVDKKQLKLIEKALGKKLYKKLYAEL